jgi:hypothetical protein
MNRPAHLSAALFVITQLVPSCTPLAPKLAPSPVPSAAAKATSPSPEAPRESAAPQKVEVDPVEPADVKLESNSCADTEKAAADAIQAQIKTMRAEVDAAFEEWRKQPLCAWLRPDGRPSRMWGDTIADSFGAGGLGLSGIGEGGGGYGEGIGLGSIGTLGHGSAAAMVRPSGATTVSRASSASGTNNQVAGVDEADFVKNDGAYVYVVANGALRIVEAMNPRVLSVMRLPGTARELFVEGDRAVVYLSSGDRKRSECKYGYDCVFAGDGTRTTVLVVDVKDRARPFTVRKIDLSGSLMAARRIGQTVHTVVADNDPIEPAYTTWLDDLPWCHENEPVVVARFARLKRENEERIRRAAAVFPTLTDRGHERNLCDILRTPAADGQAFTSVVSFDMNSDKAKVTTATIQSRPGAVFASDTGLYLAVGHSSRRGDDGDRTYVHKLRIGASPSETRYMASGSVPGHVLNQFSMDEWQGKLRIATTTGRVPDPNVESTVSILAESEGRGLVQLGAIEHIAPTEDIRAVRFDGDRAYVVTFKKTDPLFVLDLHDASAPRILGELKIPGFSTYIHRIDPTHLLSIGFDARDHGSFAYFDGVLLQLFDVTNPTEPVLLHRETIGTRGSSSEAATDHLAFNYFADKGLLAIPITLCEGGGDGVNGDKLAFSGLLLYDVDRDRGFRRLGGVDHGRKGASCGTWWSNATSHVKRSIFMDDLVYSVALDKMKVQKMDRLGQDVADISLTR